MRAQLGIAVLVGIGGILQIAGVFMVVFEIRGDRRRARELIRPQRLTLEPAVETDEALPLGVTGGKPPTEANQADAEARQAEARFRMLQATTRATRQEMHDAAAEVARMDAERDRALRRFLHEQLTGGIGRRIWGVALILSGIACSTAAGLWAVAAT